MSGSQNELGDATQSDPVLTVIEKYELFNVQCSWEVWLDALQYAARYRTVLTDDTSDSEREAYAVLFAGAAPHLIEQFTDPIWVDKIADIWYALGKQIKNVSSRMTKHVNVIEKFAELTGVFMTRTMSQNMVIPGETELYSAVTYFYREAAFFKAHELAWTAFHVPSIMETKAFVNIVAFPELPAELIEQHAFNVPSHIAKQLVVHPNTPKRIRTLLRVSLP